MNGKITQGHLDLTSKSSVPISHIDTRGWRRISVASGKCSQNCSACTCVSDLQMLARDASMDVISFGPSGNPLLSREQINILRSKREKSILDESTDSSFIMIDIPPAPLPPCSDNEL